MITTVFIDVDNTLLDFRKCSSSSIRKCLTPHGIECTEHILQVFEARNNALWRDIELGKYTVEQLRQERWNIIFAELGIEIDGLAFEDEFRQELKHSAEPVEYARELLVYLHSKYRICIASNAPQEQQELRLEKAGMLEYIDELFTSGKIGYLKPEKAFFQTCFDKLGNVKAEECMMVGDSLPADIKGAAGCGMKTCWFNYANEPVPVDVDIEHVVYSLKEICEIL